MGKPRRWPSPGWLSLLAVLLLQTVGHGQAAPVSAAEARKIFYALIEQRTAAVERNDYSKIEPLYLHTEALTVIRPGRVLKGWPQVEAYWRQSTSRPRAAPFRVYWNDDLRVNVEGGVITGGLTWSNQLADQPRRYGSLSLVLQQRNRRWQILHEHSSNWDGPAQ